jgi:hypothetical protein
MAPERGVISRDAMEDLTEFETVRFFQAWMDSWVS